MSFLSLENILDTLDEPLDGRLLQSLMSAPVNDGELSWCSYVDHANLSIHRWSMGNSTREKSAQTVLTLATGHGGKPRR